MFCNAFGYGTVLFLRQLPTDPASVTLCTNCVEQILHQREWLFQVDMIQLSPHCSGLRRRSVRDGAPPAPRGHASQLMSRPQFQPSHYCLEKMASALKTIVSKKKRRYVEDGFNLDLSYIGERIIAMGFPSENIESLYRNSLDEVKRFLDQKHRDHYKIYNLCSERSYDLSKFHGRVACYPFDDHHPPDFGTIPAFCSDVDDWLSQDKDNVAVVHCKAGKGRTGVMICCYLLHCGRFKTAEEVLSFYGQQRTMDHKGVTIPSQRRYINYYASLLRDGLTYTPTKLYLTSIVMDPAPQFPMQMGSECYFQFEVRQYNRRHAGHTYTSGCYLIKKARQVSLVVQPPILICGDVKIEFSSKMCLEMMGIKPKFMQPKKEFHFWFNTFFVDTAFSSGLSHAVLPKKPPAENNGWTEHERHASAKTSKSSGDSSDSVDLDSISNLMKHNSISDDHLLQERQAAAAAAASAAQPVPPPSSDSSSTSFIDKRIRHSSVPQTARSPGAMPHVSHHRSAHASTPHHISGTPVSIRLNKSQIDKVVKDKTSKTYADSFTMTLFLVRPTDQSDEAYAFQSPAGNPFVTSKTSSSESSSEEETTTSESNFVALQEEASEQVSSHSCVVDEYVSHDQRSVVQQESYASQQERVSTEQRSSDCVSHEQRSAAYASQGHFPDNNGEVHRMVVQQEPRTQSQWI